MNDRRRPRSAVTVGRLALLALAALTGCGAVASAGGGPSPSTVLVGAPAPTATAAPPAVLAERLTGVGPLPSTSGAIRAAAPATGVSTPRRRRAGHHRRPGPARRVAVRARSALTHAV